MPPARCQCAGLGIIYRDELVNLADITMTRAQYEERSEWIHSIIKSNQKLDAVLCSNVEIFGICIDLSYISNRGDSCGRILNLTNSIVYTDADNMPQIFIHIYKQRYDDAKHYDVHYPGRIKVYKDDVLQPIKKHIFNGFFLFTPKGLWVKIN